MPKTLSVRSKKRRKTLESTGVILRALLITMLLSFSPALLEPSSGHERKIAVWDTFQTPVGPTLSHGDKVMLAGSQVLSPAEASYVHAIPMQVLFPIKSESPRSIIEQTVKTALRHSVAQGASVINFSGSFGSFAKKDWFEGALSHQPVLFVAAAGNQGIDLDRLPAFPASLTLENTITVAASHLKRPQAFPLLDALSIRNVSRRYLGRSSFGRESVDLAAPGWELPLANGDRVSGTSYATSQVSWLAAWVHSQLPQESPSEIKKILCLTVDVDPEMLRLMRCGGILNPSRAKSLTRILRSNRGRSVEEIAFKLRARDYPTLLAHRYHQILLNRWRDGRQVAVYP